MKNPFKSLNINENKKNIPFLTLNFLCMKNFSLLFGALFLLLLGACSSPADYNTSIMDEAVKVEKEALKITNLLQEKDFKNAQNAFFEGQKQTKTSLKKLENMSAFREDDSLRQAAIKFVAFYDGLFANEYQEAFDLLKKGGPYTMDEGDHLFEVMSNVSKQGIEVKQNLIKEHLAFIERYNLIVEKK